MSGKHELALPAAWRGFCARLVRDTRGNTLILVAAALLPLIALIGSGIDMGRGYLAQNRLQQACDAAALAGRRAMTGGVLDSTVINEANKFFRFNFPVGTTGTDGSAAFGAAPFTPVIGSAANATVTVTASTTLPTTVMKMFGFDTLPLSVTCFAKQDFVNTDIMLVLDTTGSMDQDVNGNDVNGGSTSKIVGLRNAVMALFDQLAPVQAQLEAAGLRLRYGVVPYSSTVNVGNLVRGMNAAYIADSTEYQTRVANYTTPVYAPQGTEIRTLETFGSNISASDCLKYGYNQPFTGFTPNPYGEPIASSTTLTYWQPTTWGGSDVISGWGTKQCRRTKSVWPRYTTRYTFTDFSYKQRSVDTSGYKNGSALVAKSTTETIAGSNSTKEVMGGSTAARSDTNGYEPVYLATNATRDFVVPTTAPGGIYTVPALVAGTVREAPLGPATTTMSWKGCIEERDTVSTINTSSSYSIPTGAYDLNIDYIPDADGTRWRPHWPEMIWFRTGGSFTDTRWYGNQPLTENANSQISDYNSGYYACPTEAVRLKPFSRAAMKSYVDSLNPVGGTYHDIGMIWGARFLSQNGIFAADNPSTYGNMPVARYIIFLTDGQMAPNANSYTAYGVEYMDQRVTGTAWAPNQKERHIQRLRMTCQAAKNRGVSIWVIAFATGLDASLTECASSAAQASTSSSQQDLINRFTDIGKNIGALRLTQ